MSTRPPRANSRSVGEKTATLVPGVGLVDPVGPGLVGPVEDPGGGALTAGPVAALLPGPPAVFDPPPVVAPPPVAVDVAGPAVAVGSAVGPFAAATVRVAARWSGSFVTSDATVTTSSTADAALSTLRTGRRRLPWADLLAPAFVAIDSPFTR